MLANMQPNISSSPNLRNVIRYGQQMKLWRTCPGVTFQTPTQQPVWRKNKNWALRSKQAQPSTHSGEQKLINIFTSSSFSSVKWMTRVIRHIQVLSFELPKQFLTQRSIRATVRRSSGSCFRVRGGGVSQMCWVAVWKSLLLDEFYIWLRKCARPLSSRRRVRISQPVSVTSRVCSNWADRFPSLVTAVQPSGHVSSCQPPTIEQATD